MSRLNCLFCRSGGRHNRRVRSVVTMPANPVAVTSETPAKLKPNKRRSLVRIDRRYALGRRVTQLESVFRQRLGDAALDPIVDTAVRRAAEVTALAEEASARALRNDPRVSLDDVVRLQRTAAMAVHRLHLDRHRKPDGLSLSDYLRSHHGEEAET